MSERPISQKHIDEASKAGLKVLERVSGKPNSLSYRILACGHQVELRIESVRKGSFRCPACQQDEYKKTANQKGLDLVGPANDTHSLKYRFISCGHEQIITKQAVRSGQFRCSTCASLTLSEEARRSGLILVDKGEDANYRIYQHVACGHFSELAPAHVRNYGGRGQYRCKSCIKERIFAEAKRAGLSIVGDSPKPEHLVYLAECGHSLELRYDQVRRQSYKCISCLESKLTSEADRSGLRLIGAGRDKAHRLYQFIECGHTQEITTSSVRNGTFHCKFCFRGELHEKFASQGLALLGPGSNTNRRTFQIISCGHVQEIEVSSAKVGKFACHVCDDTSWTKPSNVYLLRLSVNQFTWVKLGYAKNVIARLKQYGLPSIVEVQPVFSRTFSTGEAAFKFEQSIERIFADRKLPAVEMKKWHRLNGFTECYPAELESEIKLSMLEADVSQH